MKQLITCGSPLSVSVPLFTLILRVVVEAVAVVEGTPVVGGKLVVCVVNSVAAVDFSAVGTVVGAVEEGGGGGVGSGSCRRALCTYTML
jgi:hypothetical protein